MKPKTFEKVNCEIPTLTDYSSAPPLHYWKQWPFNNIPSTPEENQSLNVKELEKLISQTNLDESEINIANFVLENAKYGAYTGSH